MGETLFGRSRDDIAIRVKAIWTDVDQLPVGMKTRRRISGASAAAPVTPAFQPGGRTHATLVVHRRRSLKGRAADVSSSRLLRLPGPTMERATSP